MIYFMAGNERAAQMGFANDSKVCCRVEKIFSLLCSLSGKKKKKKRGHSSLLQSIITLSKDKCL